jgi:hypothetical protein
MRASLMPLAVSFTREHPGTAEWPAFAVAQSGVSTRQCEWDNVSRAAVPATEVCPVHVRPAVTKKESTS